MEDGIHPDRPQISDEATGRLRRRRNDLDVPVVGLFVGLRHYREETSAS
jgi:hypothetical protein